jgi:hypothetical protein
MSNLCDSRNEIKSAAASTEGSPLMKLIAVLMAAGITKTAELAEACGVTVRAVQLARKRTPVRERGFAEANVDSPKNESGFAKTTTEQRAPYKESSLREDTHLLFLDENGRLIVKDESFRRDWIERLGSPLAFDQAVRAAQSWVKPGTAVTLGWLEGQFELQRRHALKTPSTPKAAPYGQAVPYRPRNVRPAMSAETARELASYGML